MFSFLVPVRLMYLVTRQYRSIDCYRSHSVHSLRSALFLLASRAQQLPILRLSECHGKAPECSFGLLAENCQILGVKVAVRRPLVGTWGCTFLSCAVQFSWHNGKSSGQRWWWAPVQRRLFQVRSGCPTNRCGQSSVCVCVHSPPLPYRLSCQYCTKTPNTLWPLKSVAAAFFLSTISVSALHVLIVKAENGYYHIVDLTCCWIEFL